MGPRNARLLLALLLLVAAAGSVLLAQGQRQRHEARAREFHRLVGGLGFGPALDLSDCPFGLDPRLDGACGEDRGPVPNGRCFCPRHAGSLFPYPSLKRRPPPAGPGDPPPRPRP